jgi:hypothetical protein
LSGGTDDFYEKFLIFLPNISRGVRRISVAGSRTIRSVVSLPYSYCWESGIILKLGQHLLCQEGPFLFKKRVNHAGTNRAM